MRNKRFIAAGITAGLLGGGAAGLILEASGSVGAAPGAAVATSTPSDPNAPAGAPTPTTVTGSPTGADAPAGSDDRIDREVTRWKETLAPLVADGTLTQAQADKVIAALQAAKHPLLAKSAEIIGVTLEELRAELQSGKTIAAVAVAKGKTAQAVIDGLVATAKARLDAAVAGGDITQKQADRQLARATAMIAQMVNSTNPTGKGFGDGQGKGDGRGKGHGRRDGRGPGRTDNDQTGVTTTPTTTAG